MADANCSDKVDAMRMFYDSNIIRSNQSLIVDGTERSISVWNEKSIKTRNDGLARMFCEHIWTL